MTVGDAAWWDTALGSGGIEQANANENIPSADTGVYVDTRTGQSFATQAIAESLGYGPGSKAPAATQTIPITMPDGSVFRSSYSQFWMDPTYNGPEPDLSTKAVFSTAGYARDFAGVLADMYVASGQDVSPAIAAIAKDYPAVGSSLNVPKVTTVKTAAQIAADQAKIPEKSTTTATAADDIMRQASDIANQAATWIADNLLIIVIAIAGLVIVPRLISAATGRRS